MLNDQGTIYESRQTEPPKAKRRKAITISNDKLIDYSRSPIAAEGGFDVAENETDKHQEAINQRYHQKYKEGVDEALKETVKEQYKNQYKFYGLLNKVNQVIYKVRNIIPILTDEIIIDSQKITVINRPFFFSEHIQSISIQNINDVYIETAPFFATLSIVDVGLPKSHIIKVKWFWKNQAERARRIITGLMECSKEQIDLKTLDDEGKAEKLEEIGKVKEAKTTVSYA